VPPHIASSEDDEYIFGRGACDAKGIIAAQIFAAEQLRAGGMNDVGLLFVVDEELSSTGARAANCHPRAASVRYLINGEPTNNQLGVGSKGTLRVLLKTEGRAAHSAYPEAGDSAIEKLLDVLADVRAAAWPIDDFFGETTCNLGTIAGGTRPNVIAAEAHAELLFRLTTDAELVKSILERVIADRASVQYISMTPPMRMRAVEGTSQLRDERVRPPRPDSVAELRQTGTSSTRSRAVRLLFALLMLGILTVVGLALLTSVI